MEIPVLLSLLVIIIAVGVFIGVQIAPPSENFSPKAPPSLNAYGKLISSSQNELATLEIQPEIVDYELDDTRLTAEVNRSAFREFHREITDYSSKTFDYSEENLAARMWYSGESYYIHDIGKLEPKTFYYFTFEVYQEGNSFTDGVFGQFVSYDEDEDSIKIYALWNNAEDLDTIYLADREFVSAQRPWRLSDLVEGNDYAFYFTKFSEDKGPWDRIDISENLTEYRQNGAWKHDNDLVIGQRIIVEEAGDEDGSQPGVTVAVRTYPTFVVSGGATELKIDLINKQDNSINYVIRDVKIVDENVLQPFKPQWGEPPYEERLENSVIESCKVDYDSKGNAISANSTKEIAFEVTCGDIECVKWYTSSDIHGNVIGNVTTDCRLILWGRIEFTDELGNRHILPGSGLLKQMLTTGRRTDLTVEYSREVSSKGEFFIYADYRDDEGNVINDAQIELKTSGVEGISTMRYDDSLGKYKFLWSSFYEHAPPFDEGTYQFTITAIKAGYEMQREGPYAFEII